MPLTGPASYLPTTDAFLAHWASANAALPATTPIILAGGVDWDELGVLREGLAQERAAVEAARNAVELARAEIEALKGALLERLNQFNGKLASLAPESPLMALRPKAYSQSEGMGRVLPPLDDLADLWQRYNATPATAPLTLMGGYPLATFTTDLAALKAAYPAWSTATNALTLARNRRTVTEEKIRTVLVQYRQRIPAEFAEGSAILASLPRLTPPEGSTPEAVTLSGAWDAAAAQAALAWSAVTDASVATLELRATAGPEYDAEDESVVATFAADAPATWSGTWGLAVAGAAATFKLYSLTAEGHERGSNAVTVTRPA